MDNIYPVMVIYKMRGRPFQNREGQTVYFTNTEAWRIEGFGAGELQGKHYSHVELALTYYRTVTWSYNTTNGLRDVNVTVTEVE